MNLFLVVVGFVVAAVTVGCSYPSQCLELQPSQTFISFNLLVSEKGKEDDFVILRRSLRNYCCHFRPRTTTRDDLANDVVGDVVVDDALK